MNEEEKKIVQQLLEFSYQYGDRFDIPEVLNFVSYAEEKLCLEMYWDEELVEEAMIWNQNKKALS